MTMRPATHSGQLEAAVRAGGFAPSPGPPAVPGLRLDAGARGRAPVVQLDRAGDAAARGELEREHLLLGVAQLVVLDVGHPQLMGRRHRQISWRQTLGLERAIGAGGGPVAAAHAPPGANHDIHGRPFHRLAIGRQHPTADQRLAAQLELQVGHVARHLQLLPDGPVPIGARRQPELGRQHALDLELAVAPAPGGQTTLHGWRALEQVDPHPGHRLAGPIHRAPGDHEAGVNLHLDPIDRLGQRHRHRGAHSHQASLARAHPVAAGLQIIEREVPLGIRLHVPGAVAAHAITMQHHPQLRLGHGLARAAFEHPAGDPRGRAQAQIPGGIGVHHEPVHRGRVTVRFGH